MSSTARFELPVEELDTEFKRKYPPDPFGREMDDNARVWRVYRDEAMAHDGGLLDGWHKTLDILLIFAGLFSAVATAFVVESYKLLQPDNEAYIASALQALVLAANGTRPLPALAPAQSSPSSLSRWINGLWFTSLMLSLTVALLCILVKQWLGEYVARTNASYRHLRHWARRREFYFRGVTDWHLSGFISVLPLLLHVALFLFFAGIVGLVWSLDKAIAAWLVLIEGLVLVFYAVATVIPLWYPQCPTATPLLYRVRVVLIHIWIHVLRMCSSLYRVCAWSYGTVRRYVLLPSLDVVLRLYRMGMRKVFHLSTQTSQTSAWTYLYIASLDFGYSNTPAPFQRLDTALRRTQSSSKRHLLVSDDDLAHNSVLLDCSALKWLVLSVSDPDSVATAVQSFGALEHESPLAESLRTTELLSAAVYDNSATRTPSSIGAVELMRILRALLCLHSGSAEEDAFGVVSTEVLRATLHGSSYPDMALVLAFSQRQYGVIVEIAERWRTSRSPTLSSTIAHLMRLQHMQPEDLYPLLLCSGVHDWSETEIRYALQIIWGGLRVPRVSCPLVGCTIHLGCRAICLVEATFELLSSPRWSNYAASLRDHAHRFLHMAFGYAGYYDIGSMPGMPGMIQYMATDEFLQQPFDITALENLGRSCLDPPEQWVLPDAAVALSHIQALVNLCVRLREINLNYLLSAIWKNLATAASFMLRGPAHPNTLSWEFWNEEERFRLAHGALSVPILPLLRRRNPNQEGTSCWSALWAGYYGAGQYHPLRRELVSTMASAACSAARENTLDSSMLDEFFNAIALHHVISGRSAQRLEDDEFLQLARHAVALRLSWWLDGVSALSHSDSAWNEETTGWCTRDLLLIGPCTRCAGQRPPQRWDETTEAELRDLCERLFIPLSRPAMAPPLRGAAPLEWAPSTELLTLTPYADDLEEAGDCTNVIILQSDPTPEKVQAARMSRMAILDMTSIPDRHHMTA